MDCREVRDLLPVFVDDELDAVRSREIESHVAGCPDCAGALASQRGLSTALRRDLPYHRAPDLLRARIAREVRGTLRVTGRVAAPRVWWRPLPVAAGFVLVAGGVWLAAFLPAGAARDGVVREAVSDHVRSLMASHLTDVTSSDHHTVKPWFAGRLDFSPPVTDFAASDFPLAGGRLDVLGGHPVAALVYRHRQHVINVFVWPDVREEAARTATRDGWHVVLRKHGGMAWCLVSDLNPAELTAFAQLLVQGAAP